MGPPPLRGATGEIVGSSGISTLVADGFCGFPAALVEAEEAVLRHGVLAVEASLVEKPFSAAALCARVRAVLEAPRSRDGV